MRDRLDLDIEGLIREFELYENPASDKQKAILAAAESLFSEKGFDASPTAEIAKKAQVTERTLFKHFPSKTELLRRVIFGTIVKTLLPMQLKKVRAFTQLPFASFRELLFALGKDRLETVQAHAPRLRIVLLEALQNERFRAQFVALWKKHIWNDLIRAIGKFQSGGQLRTDIRPEVVAQLMLFTIIGFALSRFIFSIVKPARPQEDLMELLEGLLSGLENPQRTPGK